MDRVCTQVLAFEETGEVIRYGSRMQHVRAVQRRRAEARSEKRSAKKSSRTEKAPAPVDKPKKLTFKEKQELEALPEQIEVLEDEKASLEEQLGDPALYKDRPGEVPGLTARLEAVPVELAALYARWEELEERAG